MHNLYCTCCIYIYAAGVGYINALRVRCNNLENGCKWDGGVLGTLSMHLNTCDYALTDCDNVCTKNGSRVKLYRKDKQDHLTNHCPRRQYRCPHCEEMGEHQERTSTHLKTCQQFSVPCPNAGIYKCRASIPRYQVLAHRSTCQYECVPCKYAEVGCKEKPQRKDLRKHEENDQLHLRATIAKVLELTQQLNENVEQLTFRMDDFPQHKNGRTTFYSGLLCTSHKGYKFLIRVHAGGFGSGEGTHISIYACLMKGDHDDALVWPFLGKVTFELLNQMEDKNHHKANIQFLNNESSQRVVETKWGDIGWGKAKFIAHADLIYNPDKNYQYLKDDAVIFRVSVLPPNYKPWLQCNHA